MGIIVTAVRADGGLLRVFAERADYRLLRKLGIELRGDILRLHVVCILTADDRDSDGFDKLCRLDASRTSLRAGEARHALVDSAAVHELVELSAQYHLCELMGMNFHLVKGGAASGALSAYHAELGLRTAFAAYLFDFLRLPRTIFPFS